MTEKVTVSRYVLLSVCIGLVLSLLALLYLSVATPNMFVPITASALILDDTVVAVAFVNGDGSVKLVNRDGTPQPPCFLDGPIVGIGGCKGAASNPSEKDSDVPAPDTVALIYATSSFTSFTSFCRRENVGGTIVRKHNTTDATPNADPKWKLGDKPCSNTEETATSHVHDHQ